LVGGQNTEVSTCQRVHHQWVDAKRQRTSGVEGVAEMLTTNKNGFAPLVDMAQLQKCASIVGRRKLTVRRPEIYDYQLPKYSKQSFAI